MLYNFKIGLKISSNFELCKYIFGTTLKFRTFLVSTSSRYKKQFQTRMRENGNKLNAFYSVLLQLFDWIYKITDEQLCRMSTVLWDWWFYCYLTILAIQIIQEIFLFQIRVTIANIEKFLCFIRFFERNSYIIYDSSICLCFNSVKWSSGLLSK
jgi:hypothetical protein